MEGVSSKKTFSKYLFGFFLLLVLAVTSYFSIASVYGAEGILRELSFYGSLKTSANTAVADGEYDVIFKIYDAPTGGNLLWTGTHTDANGNPITITNGFFNTLLGSGTGNTLSLDFNSDAYYLGITVGADSEMTPREQIGASAYAFNADKVDGLDASSFVRSNATTSIATSSADTLFTITQSGAGDILNIFDGSTEVFSILDGGYVGIGSSSPSAKLTISDGNLFVGGTITATSTGTSTFAGGINLSSGCYAINNTCIAGSNSITSLGPIGQLQTGPSIILATSTAGLDFAITGAGNTLTFSLPSASSLSRGLLTSLDWTTFNTKVSTTSIDTIAELETLTSADIVTVTADDITAVELLSIVNGDTGTGNLVFSASPAFTGSVGIGTTTPTTTLVVVPTVAGGGIYVDGSIADNINPTLRLDLGSAQYTTLTTASADTSSLAASVIGDTILKNINANALLFGTDNLERMRIDSSGNVGIGTASPQEMLDVRGLITGGTGFDTHKNYIDLQNAGDGLAALTFGLDGGSLIKMMHADDMDVGNNTALIQFQPLDSSEYGYVETYGGAGLMLGTGEDTPIVFRPNRTEIARLTTTGLGIGTTTPTQLLSLYSDTDPAISFESSTGSDVLTQENPGTLSFATSSTNYTSDGTYLSFSNGGSLGTPEIYMQTSGSAAYASLYASNEIGNGSYVSARSPQGDIFIGTDSDSYFETSYNVGIGTTSPYAKLSIHANDGDAATTLFAISSSTSATTTSLFTVSNTGDVLAYGDIYSKGMRWTAHSAAGNNDNWNSLTYGNGLFVAVGDSGDRVMTSPDGVNWTARTAAGDDDGWQGVTYGNGLFVAVGNGSDYVMTSPDGINWTARTAAGDDDEWYGIAYGNGLFVAVGQSGDRVMISLDGISWATSSAAGDDDSWNSLTYGNGLFVAVGNGGDHVITSSDGVNWTARSAAGDNDSWDTITYGNGLFVAVAESGNRVMTSPDGVNWTARSAAGDNDSWYGIAYGNGLFVAVGNGGGDYVMTSGKPEQSLLAHNNTYQGGMNIFGAVNIGTTTATTTTAYSKFTIWGNSTGNILQAVTSASSTALSVSGTGYGTTTLSGLTISGLATSTSNVGFNITTGCYAKSGICLDADFTTFGNKLGTTSIDTSAKLAAIITDETGDGALVFANNASLTGTTNLASLLTTGSSTIGGGTQTTGLTIYGGATTTGNAYFAGKIGIGVTNPTAQLNVGSERTLFDANEIAQFGTPDVWTGTGYITVRGLLGDLGGAEMATLKLGATSDSIGSGNVAFLDALAEDQSAIAQNTNLAFRVSGIERMRIVGSDGNIGIGTTSPGQKLSVAGDILGNNIIASYFTGTSTATSTLLGKLSVSGQVTLASTTITESSALTSGNTVLLTIGGDQTVARAGGGFYGISLAPRYTATSDTLGSLVGAYLNPQNTSTGDITSMYGLYTVPQNTGGGTVGTLRGIWTTPQNTAGTSTSLLGIQATPSTSGSATTTTQYGMFTNSQLTGSGAITTHFGMYTDPSIGAAGSGTVTNQYGLYVRGGNSSSAGGVVSNYYQLYLENPLSTGTFTNPTYGIYQRNASVLNYFGGNVGLNVLSPDKILTIAATTTDTTYGNQISLQSQRVAIAANSLIGGIEFRSNDTNLTAPGTVTASIQALANVTHTAGALGTDLVFNSTTATTFAEKMRLTGAGRLGIGTTSPSAQLSIHANNGSTATTLFAIGSSTASATTTLFSVSNTGDVAVTGDVDVTGNMDVAQLSSDNYFGQGDILDWNADGDGGIFLRTSGAYSLAIPSTGLGAGNVGVGTSTPAAKLTVSANAGETNTTLFAVSSSTSNSTESLFRILNTGGIIVGTNLSMTTTNIQGTDATPQFQISASGAGASSLIQRYSSNATPGRLLFLKTRGTSSSDFSAVSAGDQLGALSFAGGNGTAAAEGAQIRAYTTAANAGTAYTAGALGFWTSPGGATTPTERLTVYSNGNIGIGTTTPEANLHVYGSGSGSYTAEGYASLITITAPDNNPFGILFQNISTGTTTDAGIYHNGTGLRFGVSLPNGSLSSPLEITNQGIQLNPQASSNNPLTFLSYAGTDYGTLSGTGSYFSLGWTSDPLATSTPVLSWTTGNRVGIGTTSPTAQFTTTGSVRFATFGAGSLVTDANGNLSLSSDERLKNIEGNFTKGLAEILNIEPISYKWKAETGFDTEGVYTGFSAQNVQEFIPEAVGEDKRGFLSLSDRPLLAAVINAVKEIYATLTAHTSRIETLESEIESLRNEVEELRNEEGGGGEPEPPATPPEENSPTPEPDTVPDTTSDTPLEEDPSAEEPVPTPEPTPEPPAPEPLPEPSL